LPEAWARWVIPVSITVKVAHYGNRRYKRRGAWDQLSSRDLALITGGSNGLGLAIMKQLIQRGVKVINIDIEPMPQQLSDVGVISFQCDLSEEKEVLDVLDTIKSNYGTPTVIINNAAIRHCERFENIAIGKIQKIMQVNTLTPILIIKHFLRDKPKRLYVANISSILGLVSPSNLSIYSLTKSSIISLHDTLTHEYLSNGNIRFLLVTPGQLNTRMFQNVKPPKAFFAPVLDTAQLSEEIVHKIQQGERGVLNGPFYTHFIPLLRMLPFSVIEFARWFSEMDVSVTEDGLDT
jgi:short-subunit dehydrogenase